MSGHGVRVSSPVDGGHGQATAMRGIGALGYAEREHFFDGISTRYGLVGGRHARSAWMAEPNGSAPFRTRLIVRHPVDLTRCSGTVLVEWLNVSSGTDTAVDWEYGRDEIVRRGHVWVGVSAQQTGVSGGRALIAESPAGEMPGASLGLVGTDPQRYGTLAHPGDAYAFGIFSAAADAVYALADRALIPGLRVEQLIATGDSQSAAFLTTYVNAVHPLARRYDGFLLHSRLGIAPTLDGSFAASDLGGEPVRLRPDMTEPVFQFITETDLTHLRFAGARQEDHALLRTWEVAGTSHADWFLVERMFGGSGAAALLGTPLPINAGPHHHVFSAALRHLVRWVGDGSQPPRTAPIRLAAPPPLAVIARDDAGIALGGVRTPAVDAPVSVLSGDPPPGANQLSAGLGSTRRFTAEEMRARYGSEDGYLDAHRRAVQAALDAGAILAEDAPLIRPSWTPETATVR